MSLRILHVADWLISFFVITPVLIAFWCGIFELFDYYLNSDVTQTLRNAAITTGIGASFYLAYFIYPLLNHLLANVQPVIKHNIITVAILCCAVVHMAYWKGLWMFTYLVLEHSSSWKLNLAACMASVGVKVLTGSTSGLIFPPFSCSVDTCPEVIKPKDFSGKEFPGFTATKSLILYSLGSAVSAFLFNSFTVFSWASAFCLVDKFGLGDKDDSTLYVVLGISSATIGVMFLLEIPVAKFKHFLLKPRILAVVPLLPISMVLGDKILSTSDDISDFVFALGNDNKDSDDDDELLECRKVSRFVWSSRRFKSFVFHSVLNLVVFVIEIMFFYSSTELYARLFFKDKFYGAALSCAIGALLLNLLQIASLFGDVCGPSDWLKVFNGAEDEKETVMEKELNLYPNRYTRYFKEYLKSS